MKTTFFLVTLLLISSCASNSVCDCVKAGENLNSFSNELLTKENPTQEDADKMDALTVDRDAVCAEFQNMLAHELQEASAGCDVLEIEVE